MLSSCIPFVCIEETTSVKKNFIVLFGTKEKQLCCENSLYKVYYCYVNCHAMNPLNNSLLYSLFFGRLFSGKYFTPSQLSTGLFRWLFFKLLHAFINLRIFFNTFNMCLVYHLLVLP